jgi:YbbR domain-containing protein
MFNSLRKNFKSIIVSVLLAILLWLLVTTENRYNHRITVPIRITRLPAGKTIATRIPRKATIEVEGKGRSLIAVNFYNIGFNLDLSDVKSERKIELDKNLNFLDLPSSFDIQVREVIEPKTLEVKVDDLVRISKKIQFEGSIIPDDGYVLITHHFSQDSVMLEGPRALIRTLDFIRTDSLKVTGQKSDFRQTLALKEPAPGLITMEPKKVRVSFDIQRLVERMVYDIPVKVINCPSHLSVESVPPFLALRIKGGEKIVAGITGQEINVKIDFNHSYRPDKDEYSAIIETPPTISWTESIPATFKLKIKRK